MERHAEGLYTGTPVVGRRRQRRLDELPTEATNGPCDPSPAMTEMATRFRLEDDDGCH